MLTTIVTLISFLFITTPCEKAEKIGGPKCVYLDGKCYSVFGGCSKGLTCRLRSSGQTCGCFRDKSSIPPNSKN